MNQIELIAFILERELVTSVEVGKHFEIPTNFAFQVIRRLEEKGILRRTGGPYRFRFGLSPPAKKKLTILKHNHKRYSWMFLLGLSLELLSSFNTQNRRKSLSIDKRRSKKITLDSGQSRIMTEENTLTR